MNCRSLLFVISCTFLLLSCKEDTQTIIVTETAPAVEISVPPGIKTTSFTATFTPNEAVSHYEYALAPDGDTARDEFQNSTIAGLTRVDSGETLEKYFDNLQSESKYVLFARAYDKKGNPGPVSSYRISTAGYASWIRFVGDRSLAVSMEISSQYYSMEFALAKASDKSAFETGTLASIRTKTEITSYTATYLDVEPGTDYIFYFKARDRMDEYMPTIEIPVTTFREGECPSTSWKVDYVDPLYAWFEIIPNDKCSKIGAVACYKGMHDDIVENKSHFKGDMMQWLINWVNVENIPTSKNGPLTIDYVYFEECQLKRGIEYDIYVIHYGEGPDGEDVPASVSKYYYKDEALGEPGISGVEVSIKDVTTNSATFEFEPTDGTMIFLFDIFTEDYYQMMEGFGTDFNTLLKEFQFPYGEMWCYIPRNKTMEIPPYTKRDLEPGTDYRILIANMNYNGIDGWGPLVMKQFTTDDE